jgi:hypothetical protein
VFQEFGLQGKGLAVTLGEFIREFQEFLMGVGCGF